MVGVILLSIATVIFGCMYSFVLKYYYHRAQRQEFKSQNTIIMGLLDQDKGLLDQ